MRFHHLALVVPDMDAAIRFYVEALDYAVMFSGGWSEPAPLMDSLLALEGSSARSSFLSGPCGYLELFEFSGPKGAPAATAAPPHHAGFRHFAVTCDAPDVLAARLIKAGGSPVGEMISIPGGAPAVIYCRDPFGNIIELLRPGGRIPDVA